MSEPTPIQPIPLDLRGLRCPLPVLRTRKALRELPSGAAIEVWCTDPLAGIDIPHFVSQSGHELLATVRDGAILRFTIRTRAPADPLPQDRPAC